MEVQVKDFPVLMYTLVVSLAFPTEQGRQLPLNQCLEYQFDSPSTRIRDFPHQRFTFHICAPARLCLQVLRLFCRNRCHPDRFFQVLPRDVALNERTEWIDQGP